MPVRISRPIAVLAGLLTTLALSGPAAADGPGYADGAPRDMPRRFVHRRVPPAGFVRGYGPYAGPPAYGPRTYGPPVYGPIMRAYLPRNHGVPMYNEPPTR